MQKLKNRCFEKNFISSYSKWPKCEKFNSGDMNAKQACMAKFFRKGTILPIVKLHANIA